MFQIYSDFSDCDSVISVIISTSRNLLYVSVWQTWFKAVSHSLVFFSCNDEILVIVDFFSSKQQYVFIYLKSIPLSI